MQYEGDREGNSALGNRAYRIETRKQAPKASYSRRWAQLPDGDQKAKKKKSRNEERPGEKGDRLSDGFTKHRF